MWAVVPGDLDFRKLLLDSPKLFIRVPRTTGGTTSAFPSLQFSPGSGICCPPLPLSQVGQIASSHRELKQLSGSRSSTLIFR